MFWIRLKKRGYTRCITSLYRVMQCRGYYEKEKKKKPIYVPKPYEQMKYPGQRIQVDCKYVPLECTKGISKGVRLYQFTAIDEYSRQPIWKRSRITAAILRRSLWNMRWHSSSIPLNAYKRITDRILPNISDMITAENYIRQCSKKYCIHTK